MSKKFKPSEWSNLSVQQQSVIRWVLEETGSLELMARAGCGKTFTIMKIVDAVVNHAIGDIAIMAYNKAIADEIKSALEKTGYDWRKVQAGTVHSFGYAAWRKLSPLSKIDGKKMANIVSDMARLYDDEIYKFGSEAIVKLCGYAKQRAVGHLCPIENTEVWYDMIEHFGLENDIPEDMHLSDLVAASQKAYKTSLKMCDEVIDFDDMILAPLYFKARFWPKDWILVDESQDTNPARRALALAMLKPKTGRMVFVGDNKQAIYGFTGADSDSMSQLKKATSAKTLPLNVTRRCPKAVVKLAQSLVPDFTAHPEAPEGKVRKIDQKDLFKEKLGKTDAILCRNTAPLVVMAYSLLAKGIACKVEGREIGNGLIKLARRWKLKTLDKLLNKLDDYQARQTAKFMSRDQEERIQGVVDQVDCLRVIINKCLLAKKNSVDALVSDIESMFGNTPENEQPKVLTLSTVHRSKGREWQRVFALGRQKFMPSPYAKKDWQAEQESNLEYVLITRAKSEFIDVILTDEK